MILYCKKCGYVWGYKGAGEGPGTSCPKCKAYVAFKQRVDDPLPDGGDYSGAKFIGVTESGDLVYFDQVYRLLVTFNGHPNPYSRSHQEAIPRGKLKQAVMEIALNEGWKYRRLIADIIKLDKEAKL